MERSEFNRRGSRGELIMEFKDNLRDALKEAQHHKKLYMELEESKEKLSRICYEGYNPVINFILNSLTANYIKRSSCHDVVIGDKVYPSCNVRLFNQIINSLTNLGSVKSEDPVKDLFDNQLFVEGYLDKDPIYSKEDNRILGYIIFLTEKGMDLVNE